MSNRRFDLIYFAALLLVLGIGYWVASQDGQDDADVELASVPDFSLPAIEVEAPSEFPYTFVRFARPEAPRLRLSESMASVMVEVRAALLESSEPIEIRDDTRLARRLE